jgi:hypothetical protein
MHDVEEKAYKHFQQKAANNVIMYSLYSNYDSFQYSKLGSKTVCNV